MRRPGGVLAGWFWPWHQAKEELVANQGRLHTLEGDLGATRRSESDLRSAAETVRWVLGGWLAGWACLLVSSALATHIRYASFNKRESARVADFLLSCASFRVDATCSFRSFVAVVTVAACTMQTNERTT